MARPFPSFPKPLFQSKAKYKASDMKMSFYSDSLLMQMKLIITKRIFS